MIDILIKAWCVVGILGAVAVGTAILGLLIHLLGGNK